MIKSITLKKVFGIRMPRMEMADVEWIKEAGYKYDSSVNPTCISERYNNLSKPLKYYWESGILRVPVSVSANFRIPLFWLAFKNFPYSYFKRIAIQTLKKDGYLSLYFHPWEFTDLHNYKLPKILKEPSGPELLDKLVRLISDLKNEGSFATMNHFADTRLL